jgi:serine/threonine protein kinase
VDDDRRAVLSDFGLSRVIGDSSGPTGYTTTTVAASVRWQAPELLFDGEEDEEEEPLSPLLAPSPMSDVWSFACTAYEVR